MDWAKVGLDAVKGAATGSAVPGVGTAMGAVGGVALGIVEVSAADVIVAAATTATVVVTVAVGAAAATSAQFRSLP